MTDQPTVRLTFDVPLTPEGVHWMERIVTDLYAAGMATKATGPDTFDVSEDKEPTPPKAKGQRKRGRPRKEDTPVVAGSPTADGNTSPSELRNEALRILGEHLGTSRKASSVMKELLDQFGVASIPEVKDEDAADFLAKAKAVCSGAKLQPLDPAPEPDESMDLI